MNEKLPIPSAAQRSPAQDAEQQPAQAEENVLLLDGIVRARLKPSRKWTAHQVFYVFILDGLGGMTLSAGVNFALAYVMYTTNPSAVYLWRLPNTLAGDLAITILVQCVLTWFVELGLLRFDLRNRSVQPIGFVARPERRLLRWLFFLPRCASSDEDASNSSRRNVSQGTGTEAVRVRPRTLTLRAIPGEALRGLLLSLLCLLTLWPLGVGVVTVFGERLPGSKVEYVYGDKYVPQGFKAVMGGLVGLCTTPLMAAFWLVRAGWEADGVVDGAQEAEV